MTFSAQSRHDSVATPWIFTASLVFSVSWRLAWCSRASSLWWKAGGLGGRDPESPPRRYGDGWVAERRRDDTERDVGPRIDPISSPIL